MFLIKGHERSVDCDALPTGSSKASPSATVFQARELRAVALEQSTGELSPEQALSLAEEMVSDRRVLTLEGGRMTTLEVRARERAIERRAALLSQPAGHDVGEKARSQAMREAVERLGNPLSLEQGKAVLALTGPERAATLIGPPAPARGS